jgi:membrane associated rhomboid family serine protease
MTDDAMRCYRHPDRETRVSCSECGRGICPDCMVFAPVGIRCPEHAGSAPRPTRIADRARRVTLGGTAGIVAKALIVLNVGIYLVQLAMGAGLNAGSGWIFTHFALVGNGLYSTLEPAGVAHGEWWRLFTAPFLHYGPLHLGMNMLALWWFGPPLEEVLGRARFALLYLVGGLAGSAGALIASPDSVTVGASGAIFGIFGAAFVLERQGVAVFGGAALTIIAVNLVFTFFIPGVSIGGHLGGLAGGAAGMLAMSSFGRTHPMYGRAGTIGVLALVAIGAISVAVSYWSVT